MIGERQETDRPSSKYSWEQFGEGQVSREGSMDHWHGGSQPVFGCVLVVGSSVILNESADHRYSGVPRSLGAFEYPGREGRGVLYGLKVHKLRVLDITVRKGNGPSGNQPE